MSQRVSGGEGFVDVIQQSDSDKYARIGTAESLRRDPYIFVLQDVRGSFMSEGKFVDMTPFRRFLSKD